MIPVFIRFEIKDGDEGLYLNARDIRAIAFSKDFGTVVGTYSGSLWNIRGTPREAAARIAEARHNDAMGLDPEGDE